MSPSLGRGECRDADADHDRQTERPRRRTNCAQFRPLTPDEVNNPVSAGGDGLRPGPCVVHSRHGHRPTPSIEAAAAPWYSTVSSVSSMNASSREADCSESSCKVTWMARREIADADRFHAAHAHGTVVFSRVMWAPCSSRAARSLASSGERTRT